MSAKKISGYEVYKLYCALKSHFTLGSSYDFIKYRGHVRAKLSTYDNRPDRQYFEFLSRKYPGKEITPFLLANFVDNDNAWIGDFTEDFDTAELKYLSWRRKYEALSHTFTEDIKSIRSLLDNKGLNFIDLFDVTKQKHPALFRFLLYGMINIETFIILNDIQHFYSVFDSKFSEDPLWVQWKFRCEKYRPFLNIDREKYMQIMKNIFS